MKNKRYIALNLQTESAFAIVSFTSSIKDIQENKISSSSRIKIKNALQQYFDADRVEIDETIHTNCNGYLSGKVYGTISIDGEIIVKVIDFKQTYLF